MIGKTKTNNTGVFIITAPCVHILLHILFLFFFVQIIVLEIFKLRDRLIDEIFHILYKKKTL